MKSDMAMETMGFSKKQELAEFLHIDVKKIYNWDLRSSFPEFLPRLLYKYKAKERENERLKNDLAIISKELKNAEEYIERIKSDYDQMLLKTYNILVDRRDNEK